MNPKRPAPGIPKERAFPRKALGILPWRRWSLRKVELVRFPFWAFPWTGKGPGGAWAVDALEGGLRLLHPGLLEEDREAPGSAPDLEFPFRLSREEALEIVRRQAPLHVPLLRRAGLEALPSLEEEGIPLLYPFWAGYLERKGRIRPLLADAVTGAPGGPSLTRTFLSGLEGISPSPSGSLPGGPSRSPSRGSPPGHGGVRG